MQPLLEPASTDDELTDQIQQPFQPIAADTDDFAIFCGFTIRRFTFCRPGRLDFFLTAAFLLYRSIDAMNGWPHLYHLSRQWLIQLFESLYRDSKSLAHHVEGGGIPPHQQACHIDRSQQHVRMPRENLDTALTHCPHEIFDIVSQIADRLEPNGIGRPLERMSCPEKLIDHFRVVLVPLETK